MEDPVEMYTLQEGKSMKNTNLQLRETARAGKMPMNTTNSVFKMQRQLFARSERVKGIDFHPVEPWILTTLYSGMFLGASHIGIVPDDNSLQVMSIYGHTRLRYASKLLLFISKQLLTLPRQ
jgi:coatomer subunit beta'